MVLTNQELYMYSNKEAKVHHSFIVLTPGVFVKKLAPLILPHEGEDKNFRDCKKDKKMFPIEIYVGGMIGNIGIDTEHNTTGKQNVVFTLFFED